MEILIPYLQIVGGLLGLYAGGEFLVRGAVSMSRRFGLSPLLIGLTVVAFSTSTPELLVSIGSVFDGSPDIAVANIVGTNTANVLFILGITALVSPIIINKKLIRKDLLVMLGASFALLAVSLLSTEIGLVAGILFTIGIAGYTIFAYMSGQKQSKAYNETHEKPLTLHDVENPCPKTTTDSVDKDRPLWLTLVLLVGGLGGLIVGADWLVAGAKTIALGLGISEAIIGLTIVAVGTSLPELSSGIISALHKKSDIAVGNVVGSGIFNVLGILGFIAIVKPISINPIIALIDIPVMIATLVVFTAVVLIRGKIDRITASIFLIAYVGYIVFSYFNYAAIM